MNDDILKATHQGELKFGDTIIPCAVLNDEEHTRVLTLRGFSKALGRAQRRKGIALQDGTIPPPFLAANNLKPFLSKELLADTIPIYFKGGGTKAYGYKATLLPEVCDVFLRAREAGVLLPRQEHIAVRSEILVRGLATVGIIGLVDEATNFQEVRDRLALQEILDKYLLSYKAEWAKRFPDSFYKAIFKLKGWSYDPRSVKRPSIIGTITNDIVYERLAPGILEELKKRTPKDEKGRRKFRYHQLLTEDLGHPKLQEHLIRAEILMDASPNYPAFHRLLQRALPKVGETYPMDLLEE